MTVLASDSFNRADTNSGLGTTDSFNGGTATVWQRHAGDQVGIASNEAFPYNGSNPLYNFLDCGQSDVSISVDIPNYQDAFACMFRLDPVANTGLLFHQSGGQLQSFNGGAYTTIASTGTGVPTGSTVKVTLQGSTITVYINGTQVLTATSALNQTSTKHGLGNWTGSGSCRWDNFQIESIAGTSTVYTDSPIATGAASATASAVTIQAAAGVATAGSSATASASSVYEASAIGTGAASASVTFGGSVTTDAPTGSGAASASASAQYIHPAAAGSLGTSSGSADAQLIKNGIATASALSATALATPSAIFSGQAAAHGQGWMDWIQMISGTFYYYLEKVRSFGLLE